MQTFTIARRRSRSPRESFAGEPPGRAVAPGTAVRIFTGAAMPPGADRVVLQEDILRDGAGIVIPALDHGKTHVRRAGSDFALGDTLVRAGVRLTPGRLLAAAAGDLAEVEVYARPKVAIMATGDELRPPGAAVAPAGSIPESASFGVAGLARSFGAEVEVAPSQPDSLPRLRGAARELIASADIVVVIGGASVGDRDFSRSMFDGTGLRILFSKVAMRPGKPVWFGQTPGTCVIGLPGNPGAALITARLFLAPMIAGLSGLAPRSVLDWRRHPLASGIEATGPLECLFGGRDLGGAIEILANRDSSAQRALADIDVLVRRPPHAGAAAMGDRVEALPF